MIVQILGTAGRAHAGETFALSGMAHLHDRMRLFCKGLYPLEKKLMKIWWIVGRIRVVAELTPVALPITDTV